MTMIIHLGCTCPGHIGWSVTHALDDGETPEQVVSAVLDQTPQHPGCESGLSAAWEYADSHQRPVAGRAG